ncbi:MAG: uracil phosphoribosyltransferase [Acetilactobacillus jinshanensis]
MAIIRNKHTSVKQFRDTIKEVTLLLELTGKKLAIAPILRAGLGMLDGMLELIPSARIACIGLYRDPKTQIPHEYFVKCPNDITKRKVFMVDPMVATGTTAIDAIGALVKRGVSPSNITFLCIICSPNGINKILKKYPKVIFNTSEEDGPLTPQNYNAYGFGDAGDRLFGTKGCLTS